MLFQTGRWTVTDCRSRETRPQASGLWQTSRGSATEPSLCTRTLPTDGRANQCQPHGPRVPRDREGSRWRPLPRCRPSQGPPSRGLENSEGGAAEQARLPSRGAGPVFSKSVSIKLPTRRSGTFHLHLQASAEMCRRDRGSQQSHPTPSPGCLPGPPRGRGRDLQRGGDRGLVCLWSRGRRGGQDSCGTGQPRRAVGRGRLLESWVSSVTGPATPSEACFRPYLLLLFSPDFRSMINFLVTGTKLPHIFD